MAIVCHVTSSSGLRKFQTDGFLFVGVYICEKWLCKSTILRRIFQVVTGQNNWDVVWSWKGAWMRSLLCYDIFLQISFNILHKRSGFQVSVLFLSPRMVSEHEYKFYWMGARNMCHRRDHFQHYCNSVSMPVIDLWQWPLLLGWYILKCMGGLSGPKVVGGHM
jgi:hypothetical protein